MQQNRGLVSAVFVRGLGITRGSEGSERAHWQLRNGRGRVGEQWPRRLRRAAQVRFVVMNNLFPTSLPVQRQYDLKGSTLGRTAAGRGSVLKDLDLDLSIHLEEGWHDKRAPPAPGLLLPIMCFCMRRMVAVEAPLCMQHCCTTKRSYEEQQLCLPSFDRSSV